MWKPYTLWLVNKLSIKFTTPFEVNQLYNCFPRLFKIAHRFSRLKPNLTKKPDLIGGSRSRQCACPNRGDSPNA